MAVDWNFLKSVEGKENTTYIPMEKGKVIQNSGVTVGTGVDLGQQTAAGFRKMGVSEEIIEKLKPFFNKKKDKAVEALNKKGEITLSDEEVFEIDEALKKNTLKSVKSWYNKDNKLGQDWADLSDRQQTVALSVFYNHGLDGAPNFKKQVASGDWTGAIENLRSFYKSDDNELHERRIKEAQYLAGLPPEEIDGIDGDITAEAVEKFKNTVGVSTPDAVRPEQPDIGSLEYFSNMMQMVNSRRKDRQRGSQTPSRSDTVPEEQIPEEEREPTGSDRLAKALGEAMRGRRMADEAGLERTANEAELEQTAEEAEKEAKPDKARLGSGSLAEALSKSEVVRAKASSQRRATGTRETEEPVRVEKGESRDDSKDPIYGIF